MLDKVTIKGYRDMRNFRGFLGILQMGTVTSNSNATPNPGWTRYPQHLYPQPIILDKGLHESLSEIPLGFGDIRNLPTRKACGNYLSMVPTWLADLKEGGWW
jgi:hypothetical protein